MKRILPLIAISLLVAYAQEKPTPSAQKSSATQTATAKPSAAETPTAKTLTDTEAGLVENISLKIELVQRRAQIELMQLQSAFASARQKACEDAGIAGDCDVAQDSQSGKWTATPKPKTAQPTAQANTSSSAPQAKK